MKKQNHSIDVIHSKNGNTIVNVSSKDYERSTSIDIRTESAMYVEIGDKTVYIDYSTEDLIVNVSKSK